MQLYTTRSGVFDRDDDSRGGNLYVSSIYHKSFMEVNEGSTEVTAASAAVVFQKTAFVDKMDFVADHSFLFPDQRRQVDLR
ncbi:hypothetical protein H0E87_023980 [Populus deltoides]|uniref:Serpin domain-containing protein n=1 Tax=Populus deltoides TaxID=3696 RepID=A0A8T2X7X6_POPDE|nr:hypothetical protein H0E87_023980 [Populus deltoides]